jgi:hypothetical protein
MIARLCPCLHRSQSILPAIQYLRQQHLSMAPALALENFGQDVANRPDSLGSLQDDGLQPGHLASSSYEHQIVPHHSASLL